MRKTLLLTIFLFTATFLSGCAAVSSPVSNGLLFTNVKGPVAVTGDSNIYSKVGTSSCITVLGIVATGDASIETAMKNGGISKIHHVDHKSTSILCIYAKYVTIVYGE